MRVRTEMNKCVLVLQLCHPDRSRALCGGAEGSRFPRFLPDSFCSFLRRRRRACPELSEGISDGDRNYPRLRSDPPPGFWQQSQTIFKCSKLHYYAMTSLSQTSSTHSWLQVEDYGYPGGWSVAQPVQRSSDYCRELEAGRILFFSGVPFALPAEDCAFLISQKQTGSRFHKNISYRPRQDVLRGASVENSADQQRLHSIMREYSRQITQFVAAFLAPYAGKLALDFASFRPLEEQGRDLPLHKRNDLLHVDAFPTRPTRGARILRVFNNLNPTVPRIWRTG